MSSRGISCAINPEAGKEFESFVKIHKAEKKKKVAIIGSGPAGLQAALTASERGHNVTLFEKLDRLGLCTMLDYQILRKIIGITQYIIGAVDIVM